jgi:c-di-GMP-binding flagellar brake protein YcgR
MDRLSSSSPSNITENGAEKRRWPRYHIDVPVKAMVRCQGQSKMIHGMANNLSLGGMAAQLPVELVIGEWLEVLVTLPFCSQPVKVRAVVRNRRSSLYGLEFSRITPSQQAAIERACYSLALVQ